MCISTYLILEEHAVITNSTTKVIDIGTACFMTTNCSTTFTAVAAGECEPPLKRCIDVDQRTVQSLVDFLRPEGAVQVYPCIHCIVE